MRFDGQGQAHGLIRSEPLNGFTRIRFGYNWLAALYYARVCRGYPVLSLFRYNVITYTEQFYYFNGNAVLFKYFPLQGLLKGLPELDSTTRNLPLTTLIPGALSSKSKEQAAAPVEDRGTHTHPDTVNTALHNHVQWSAGSLILHVHHSLQLAFMN
jgi:hypothetical protein